MNQRAEIVVKAKQLNGTLTEITSGAHTWYIDEPPFFNGEDRAPSPVQALLGALAGCLAAAGYQTAQEMGLPLRDLKCSITGQVCADRFFGRMDSDERAGFSGIHFELEGLEDWHPAQRALWLEQVMNRCPVVDNLMHETPVTASWKGARAGSD